MPSVLLRALAVAGALLGLVPTARAEVRLAQVFGDHMVLQREMPLRVWGWARPGEAVRVAFRAQLLATVADATGRWAVTLAGERAGGPDVLRVQGESNELRREDVLVGEVWLASGQSNMEWPLRETSGGAADVAAANHPWLRQLAVPRRPALQPQADMPPAPWRVATPQSAGEFSAVAYHFALQLHQVLGVPVGIVNMSWGGTHLETWSRPAALARHPAFALLARGLPADMAAYEAGRRAALAAQLQRFQPGLALPSADEALGWKDPALDDSRWPTLNAPQAWEEQGLADFDGVVWYRRTLALSAAQAALPAVLHLGTIDDCDETYVNGTPVGGVCQWDLPRRHEIPPGLLKPGANVIAVRVTDTGGGGGFYGPKNGLRLELGLQVVPLAGPWRARVEAPRVNPGLQPNDLPGLLYNGMVEPVAGYALRGAIWYQGESNVPRAAQYAETFPMLIEDWRRRWGQGDFPFHFVQLAAFGPTGSDPPGGSEWAELREAQRRTLAVPRTGMAVAIDIGDSQDIHPRNKREVGRRLALLALRQDYGRRDVVAQGPVPRGQRVRGGAIEIEFEPFAAPLAVRGGGVLRGFDIAGPDRRFLPASAVIVGGKVEVSNPAVPHPVAVRYAWHDDPADANLVNAAGLPAGPFRTDDWPLLTQGATFAN